MYQVGKREMIEMMVSVTNKCKYFIIFVSTILKICLEILMHNRERGCFQLTIRNESLHQDSNENGVRTQNLTKPKNLIVKSTMFPHQNIHKYTCTNPDGKTHNQIDHVLIESRWLLCILNV
jgi:hypothetical protein